MKEEEAIEQLRKTAQQCRNHTECWEEEFCSDCYMEVEDTYAIETVLNLIQKQKKEIKKLKELSAWRIGYCQALEKDLFENCSNVVIPKKKIEDKINELRNSSRITGVMRTVAITTLEDLLK